MDSRLDANQTAGASANVQPSSSSPMQALLSAKVTNSRFIGTKRTQRSIDSSNAAPVPAQPRDGVAGTTRTTRSRSKIVTNTNKTTVNEPYTSNDTNSIASNSDSTTSDPQPVDCAPPKSKSAPPEVGDVQEVVQVVAGIRSHRAYSPEELQALEELFIESKGNPSVAQRKVLAERLDRYVLFTIIPLPYRSYIGCSNLWRVYRKYNSILSWMARRNERAQAQAKLEDDYVATGSSKKRKVATTTTSTRNVRAKKSDSQKATKDSQIIVRKAPIRPFPASHSNTNDGNSFTFSFRMPMRTIENSRATSSFNRLGNLVGAESCIRSTSTGSSSNWPLRSDGGQYPNPLSAHTRVIRSLYSNHSLSSASSGGRQEPLQGSSLAPYSRRRDPRELFVAESLLSMSQQSENAAAA